MKSKLIFILYFALAMFGTVTAQERSDCHEFRIGDDVDRYKASYGSPDKPGGLSI